MNDLNKYNHQKGFINLNLAPLLVLAVIGVIGLIVGIPTVLYWVFKHISIMVI